MPTCATVNRRRRSYTSTRPGRWLSASTCRAGSLRSMKFHWPVWRRGRGGRRTARSNCSGCGSALPRPPCGAIQPVVKRFVVNVLGSPFASQPAVQLTVSAEGIDGAGITSVAPELHDRIDGGGMTDSRFVAQFEAQATKIERKGSAGFVLDK